MIAEIFVGILLSMILENTLDQAKNEFLQKSAVEIFKNCSERLNDKNLLYKIEMKGFLELCDPEKYPKSRKIIENAYLTLCITENEIETLFRDFKKVFSGEEEDLRIIFDDFIEIFLQELVKNSKETTWKYRVWKELKTKTEHKFLLESLEEALKFGKVESKWFRGSPSWIDFEENKIYRREEVGKIKGKLKTYTRKKIGKLKEEFEKKNIQIVYGDLASGKSTIVKQIGFDFCKKPRSVFLINLKTEKLENYKNDIVHLLDRDALLIIEDAHLAFHAVDWLVSKASGRELKILISTRPLEQKTTPREPTKIEVLMKDDKSSTKIEASKGAREIIEFYLFEKFGMEKNTISQRIVEDMVSKFGEDLWLLSFALEAFLPNEGVKKDMIYRSIFERYLDKTTVGMDSFVYDAYIYLYPICVFNQYEIPVCKDFLIRDLCLDKRDLDRLIEAGEILKEGRMLFLHHSSRARYFLETMLQYQLYEEEKEIELMQRYIQSFPQFSCPMIIRIAYYFNRFNLVENLISNPETFEKIVKGVDKTDDILDVARLLSLILRINENVGLNLILSIARKINNTDSISDIGDFFLIASGTGKTIEEIDLQRLATKINNSKYVEDIGKCFSGVAEASEKIARDLAEKIDLKSLTAKIDEANLEDTGKCFSGVAKANEKIALKLVPIVEKKMDKTDSLADIENLFLKTVVTSENVGLAFSPTLGIRIEEYDNLRDIVKLVSRILILDENIALDLLPSIANKIEEDISENIWRYISKFSKSNRKFAVKLVEEIGIKRLANRIDNTNDLWSIGWCFQIATRISKNIAGKLAEEMDLQRLAAKTDEANLEDIGKCFSGVAEASEKIAGKLAEEMDLQRLAAKINEATSPEDAEWCFSEIKKVNSNATRILLEKINRII